MGVKIQTTIRNSLHPSNFAARITLLSKLLICKYNNNVDVGSQSAIPEIITEKRVSTNPNARNIRYFEAKITCVGIKIKIIISSVITLRMRSSIYTMQYAAGTANKQTNTAVVPETTKLFHSFFGHDSQ